MYESGLSKKAKVLFLGIMILLGYLFLRMSGCSSFAQEVSVYELSKDGKVTASFFLK